jgi:hypothetical protein
MDVSYLLLIAAICILPAAVIALLLYFVVRLAVLAALRTHAAEQSAVHRAAGD